MSGWGALLRDCALCALAGFALAGMRIAGTALPLAACLCAVLPTGLRPVFAAAGAAGGYFVFSQGGETAELVSAAILMLASTAVFQGTELPARRWFFPAIAGAVAAVLGAVFFLSDPSLTAFGQWGLKILCAAGGTFCLRAASQGDRRGRLFSAAALLCGLSGMPLPIDMGLAAGAALTLCAPEVTAVAAFGVALEVSGDAGWAAAALMLPAVVWRVGRMRNNALRACVGLALTGATAVLGGGGLRAILAVALGECAGLLLARAQLPWLQFSATAKEHVAHTLDDAAEVLESLQSQVLLADRLKPEQSEADTVFDGAADRVCRCCPRLHRCWEHSAERTYYALTGAAKQIIERGVARPEDFPEEFREGCCHLEGFLTAVNQELEGMLYLRRYRMQMGEARQVVAKEFSCVAGFLRDMQQELHEDGHGRGAYLPMTGVSTARKPGNFANGDRGVCFFGPRADYYVLLCDGMGSGREAAALSSETVHFLKKLLYSGMEPEDALQVLNGAFLLRGTGCFATVDLLWLDLVRGEGELLKWGGAPAYLRENEAHIKKMGAAALPPGVGVGGEHAPERYPVSLKSGELLILLSDGAGSEETESVLSGYTGNSPRELAALLLAGAPAEDDMTAVVLSLRPRT